MPRPWNLLLDLILLHGKHLSWKLGGGGWWFTCSTFTTHLFSLHTSCFCLSRFLGGVAYLLPTVLPFPLFSASVIYLSDQFLLALVFRFVRVLVISSVCITRFIFLRRQFYLSVLPASPASIEHIVDDYTVYH